MQWKIQDQLSWSDGVNNSLFVGMNWIIIILFDDSFIMQLV